MTVPLSVTAEASGLDVRPLEPEFAGGTDARTCAAVVREHARTFYFASWLLPPAKRRAAYALYAFCRVADDLVDRAQGRYGRAPSPAEIARQLGEYERALDVTLAAGPGAGHALTAARLPGAARPHAAVFRELRDVLDRYGVPEPVLRELLAGVARDLAPTAYATWPDLVRYCEGVASSVGEMCTYVFGVTDAPAAAPGRRPRPRPRRSPRRGAPARPAPARSATPAPWAWPCSSPTSSATWARTPAAAAATSPTTRSPPSDCRASTCSATRR
jgi:hypothetical protein